MFCGAESGAQSPEGPRAAAMQIAVVQKAVERLFKTIGGDCGAPRSSNVPSNDSSRIRSASVSSDSSPLSYSASRVRPQPPPMRGMLPPTRGIRPMTPMTPPGKPLPAAKPCRLSGPPISMTRDSPVSPLCDNLSFELPSSPLTTLGEPFRRTSLRGLPPMRRGSPSFPRGGSSTYN